MGWYTTETGWVRSSWRTTLLGTGGTPSTLREQIEDLKTGITPNGRQSTATLKIPSAGNLPAGCTLSGKILTFSGNGITLEDWDFTDKRVDVAGTDQTIQNCYWGPVEVVPSAQYCIQIKTTAIRPTIRYNTIDGFDGYGGPTTFINIPSTGSGADARGAIDWLIEYNRYLHPNSDVLKAAGAGINQWNYYGPLTNYPAGTALWSAGTTYAAGQYVLSPVSSSLGLFRSFAGGNTGNAPASSKTDTAFWEGLDPHGDANTQTASNPNGTIHRHNMIDWGPAITHAVGVTQSIRVVRNTGESSYMGPVDFTNNVIPGPYAGFYPLAAGYIRSWLSGTTYDLGGFASSPDGSVYYVSLAAGNKGNDPATSPALWAVTTDIFDPGPVRFIGNWVGAGSGGLYHSIGENSVDAWSGNEDYVTGAAIAGPTLRTQKTPLVASIIGQSENVVGFTQNASYYTAGPYPALLAGVDAKIAAHPASDDSGVATIHTASTAEITAKTVNPGFIALANLWHTGSSGRPLRLVADVVAGTSLPNMLDDATGDGREFSDSVALVSLAQSAWGNVKRVVYNWWNAEAPVAKTLYASRAPHFFGVTSSGANYDFTAGDLEHCIIDTTGRGYGLYPENAVLDLMLPGIRLWTTTDLYDPPCVNYGTDITGGAIAGMIGGNSAPSYAQRDNVVTQAPSANKGVSTISPALVRFGDYSGGALLSSPAQSLIHPSMKHKDGQQLFSQDVAAHLLIAEGHAQISTLKRVDQITATTFDFVFSIPTGGVLTTQRILDAETVATPRPHQQQVMGFVVARGADTDRTMRPIYRTDTTDATLYPTAYRGTVTIYNSGVDVTGGREATVRVVMSEALANNDRILLGNDGGYGGFILSGWPDYDAFLYRDGLRVYESRLDDGTANRYPGIPVRVQVSHTVGTVTTPEIGWAASGGTNQITITTMPTVTAPVATGGTNQITVIG